MKYTNLKDSPEFVEKTYKMIEDSFGYDGQNSFNIDFYPLMKKDNHHNCHIYIDNNEVVAHIGVLNRNFAIEETLFPFSMYGGIAVSTHHRGMGIFKKLFKEIEQYYQNSAFHILWSEKIELYKKYDFFPCINLNEYKKQTSPQNKNINPTKLALLENEEFEKIKQLYNSSSELRVQRSDEHWLELKKISSSDLYLIKEKGIILNYFLMNKGQDLTEVIHEYGIIDESYLNFFQEYGNVWTPFESKQENTNLFAALVKIGDKDLFSLFTMNYLGIKILEYKESSVSFEFESNIHTFLKEELLQGFLGPGRFKEIYAPKIFISGLDSI